MAGKKRSIADVYVSVIPETSRVASGIARAFRDADREVKDAAGRWRRDIDRELSDVSVDVNVGADTGKAEKEIRNLDGDTVEVKVGADTSKAEAEIGRLGGKTVEVDVDVNESALDRLNRRIEGRTTRGGRDGGMFGSISGAIGSGISGIADKLARSLAEASDAAAESGTKLGGMFSSSFLKSASQGMAAVSEAGGPIGTAVLGTALAGAAIDLAGVAASAAQSLWLLPAAGTAAAAGIGTLVGAMQGFGDVMKAMDDPKKFAKAIQDLAPAAQQAALAIQAMWPQIQQAFTKGPQEALFANMAQMLNGLANTYLPLVQNMTTRIASAFNSAFANVSNLLQQPQMIQTMKSIFDNIARAFEVGAQAAAPFTQAIAQIVQVGSGFLPAIAQAITDIANRFANFINQAASSGQLQQWIQSGLTMLGQLGTIIGWVVDSFMRLAPVGDRAMPSIMFAIKGIIDLFNELAPVIGAVVIPVFYQIGFSCQLVATQLRIVGEVARFAFTVAGQMASWLWNIAKISFGGIRGVIGAVVDHLKGPFVAAITWAREHFGGLWDNAVKVVNWAWDKIRPVIDWISDKIQKLMDGPMGSLIRGAGQLMGMGDGSAGSPGVGSSGNGTKPVLEIVPSGGAWTGSRDTAAKTATVPGMNAGSATVHVGAPSSNPFNFDPSQNAVTPVPDGGYAVPAPPPEKGTKPKKAEDPNKYKAPDWSQVPYTGGSPAVDAASAPTPIAPAPAPAAPSPIIPASALPQGLSPSTGLKPAAEQLNNIITQAFPELKTIGGYRAQDPYPDHPSGRALDIMVGDNLKLGDGVNEFLMKHAAELGVEYTLWRQAEWKPGQGASPMAPRPGGKTGNHFDHVHAYVKDGAAPAVQVARTDGLNQPYTAAAGSLPGLYEVPAANYPGKADYADDKKVREASQRVSDTDFAVQQAQQRLEEMRLEDQTKIRPSERVAAEHALAKAQRDHADALADLTAAQQDYNKAALAEPDAKKRKAGQDKSASLAEDFGRNIAGGLMEGLGFDGSIFKDPTQFGLFKLLGGLSKVKVGGGAATGGGSDGGGGLAGSLLSNIPQAFGAINVGSPQDAAVPFVPAGADAGGAALIPGSQFTGSQPQPAQTTNNYTVDNSMNLEGAQFGTSDLSSSVAPQQAAQGRTRVALRSVP